MRYRRWLFALIAAVMSLCGCFQSDGELLRPYQEELVKDSYSSSQKMFRQEGIAGSICVVGDESIYDESYIDAPAAVLFNITQKETIYSKNAFEQLKMASLTKMMTALLAFKYGDLDQTVTLTDEVKITTYNALLCGFQPNDRVNLRDLVKATLVYSGNDAANAVAVAVGGNLETFVDMMNNEARVLGATDTHFKNPNGLDEDGHYSSAYDLYLIFNACLKYPEFREIIPLPKITCTYTKASGEEVTRQFNSGNGYLNNTAHPPKGITAFGGKTGNTDKAGQCLVTLAKDEKGEEYIAVVLGAETKQQVYAQTNLLLDKIP